MDMNGKSVFIAGADGGIGQPLCQLFTQAGAKVFRGVMHESTMPLTVSIDVTNPASVASAVNITGPLDLVINATGILRHPVNNPEEGILVAKDEFEVNCFGMLRLAHAFLPSLRQRANSRLINLLSVTAWVALPSHAGYAASKAAAWSYTNSLRLEFAQYGVGVTGVILGYTDTPMTQHINGPKITPDVIAQAIFEGIKNEEDEILCDKRSQDVKSMLSDDLELIYRPLLNKTKQEAQY
ncbi:hypothetical protein CN514_12670 [Bacillus sp. AFS001701]|uniref:SDR family NAD(P)-dependent oxidoreductase n=1 Tax=Bacillus sp. AFS001701 TaxID=2033480 RepID=UPI000BF88287|nr:SDR family NAD(P)-dependent oxidoreductase [Bacillus sp. AFS001701]PET64806.1 hypothetical protein CN514_12670 [Bacillus sp. AFS001701]